MTEQDYAAEKAEAARALFLKGYNCSQAVCGAFASDFGMEPELLLRLSASFGGGMGRMREVCGAVSGMAIVCGLQNGSADPADRTAKAENYALIRACADAFRAENGSILCRELLERSGNPAERESAVPTERDAQFYKKRPCADMVALAARLVAERICPAGAEKES